MIRYLTAGESHGPGLTIIIDGFPAGLKVSAEQINQELARRQVGYGRGGRMQIEKDQVQIKSGIRWGETIGSPVALYIENRDFANWQEKMSPQEQHKGTAEPVLAPRPGHADLAGIQKFNREDVRDILERASARETAARVAGGALAKLFLAEFGILIISNVLQIGSVIANTGGLTYQEIKDRAEKSELRCADPEAEEAMKKLIDEAQEKGDSLGGVAEIIALGVPPGLGSHTQWDKKLDGLLAGSLMSIQAIKGVEIGAGFTVAELFGSQVHDEIIFKNGKIIRPTNNAGGIEGGMSNGQPIVARIAMKPIPTLRKPKRTFNLLTGAEVLAAKERSDVTAVPAAGVIAEAIMALTLAQLLREKFGGDSMPEIKLNYHSYLQQVKDNMPK